MFVLDLRQFHYLSFLFGSFLCWKHNLYFHISPIIQVIVPSQSLLPINFNLQLWLCAESNPGHAKNKKERDDDH